MIAWQRFVLEHGWRALAYDLAAVVAQPLAAVLKLRATHACTRRAKPKSFPELFTAFHGRPPRDDEWPRPRRCYRNGHYEWQLPEETLLVSLVGRLGKKQIARVLTKRLQRLTGDRRARRTPNSVQIAMGRLGLVTTDVVGGITVAEAGKEVGGYYMVWGAIKRGQLPSFKVGSVMAIPHAAWAKWKASRVFPPQGYVQLSTLKRPLSITSDKLARMGYVPTAIRCNPWGAKVRTTKFGTWFLDGKVARKLVADRRAGRPMPWWGKPDLGNLKITYRLWLKRKHPAECEICAAIWGPKGAPDSFDEYCERYHPLEHGQKRHLTRPWSAGLSIGQVAKFASRSWACVRRAIDNGMLQVKRRGTRFFITRTEATRWKARRCPMGNSRYSWLAIGTAAKQYRFTRGELLAFIKAGKLMSRVGDFGAAKGILYVARHQCALLREQIGFSEEEAARRAGVTLKRFRELLKGVEWRRVGNGIPLQTLQAVQKKLEARHGRSFEQAAEDLGVSVEWVKARKDDGTIRVARATWDRRCYYISDPMFRRLQRALKAKPRYEDLGADWLYSSEAGIEAGVSIGTIVRWRNAGELERKASSRGFRYQRAQLRARARRYWLNEIRLSRAIPPEWFRKEQANEDHDREHGANGRRRRPGPERRVPDPRQGVGRHDGHGDQGGLPRHAHRRASGPGPVAVPA